MNFSTHVALIAAIFSFALGLIAWVSRERTRTTLPFTLVCFFFGIYCAAKVAYLFTGGLFYNQVAIASGIFLPASFYFLLSIYLASEKRVIGAMVVLFFAAAGIATGFVFSSTWKPDEFKPALFTYGSTAFLAAFLVTGIVWVFQRAQQENLRQPRRSLIATGVMIAALLVVFVAESLVEPTGLLPPWTLIAGCLLLYFFHQTVVLYRFFGLRRLVGKIALLIASTVFLAIVFGLLVFLIGASPLRFAFHTFIAAFLLLILYEPVLSRIEAGTVRWLFGSGDKERRRFSSLARDLSDRIGVPELIRFLTESVPAELKVRGAQVFLFEQGKFQRTGSSPALDAVFESPALVGRMKTTGAPVQLNALRREAFDRYPGPARDELIGVVQTLAKASAQVLIPLRNQGRLIGFWSIDTGAGPEIDTETGEVLLALADQAALRIINARIYQQMKIKDRLATVGEMAAGLAHEIRNPLGSMKGAAEYLSDEPLPPGASEFIQIIIDEAKRLNEVLTRFLDFARPFQIKISKVDLCDLVRRVVGLLQNDKASEAIDIRVDLPDNPVNANVDEHLMQQVLINLAKNGIEAMDERGELTFALSVDGDFADISVCDSGPGIAPEQLDRIFEPFFSTKKQGTGLGLAISQRICEAHRGVLTVRSTIGEGTCFNTRFPFEFAPEKSNEASNVETGQ